MVLQQLILKLDTAYDKIYKINRDAAMRGTVEAFAADTTKPGCWWARAILHQVDGKDMRFMWPIQESGSRIANMNSTETEEAGQQGGDLVMTHEKGGLNIYPNPAGNSFKIQFNSSEGTPCLVLIRDILGKVINSHIIQPNSLYEIVTKELNMGIYFVTLIQGNKLAGNKKLVIIK